MKLLTLSILLIISNATYATVKECLTGMEEAKKYLKQQQSIKITESDWQLVIKECEENGELYSKQFKSMSSIMKSMNSKQISCKLGSGFIAHDRFLRKYSNSTHTLGMAIGENGQRFCMSKY